MLFLAAASHRPLVRKIKLQVVHALGMPGTVSLPPWVGDPNMHHGTCMRQMPWCMPGSLTSSFLWSQWQGKCSRHSMCMCNPPFFYLVRGLCQGPINMFTDAHGSGLDMFAPDYECSWTLITTFVIMHTRNLHYTCNFQTMHCLLINLGLNIYCFWCEEWWWNNVDSNNMGEIK